MIRAPCPAIHQSPPLCYVISSHKERPDSRQSTGSMFNIILPLTCFPLRNKAAVRNRLFMSDFLPPVNSLNAPSIPVAGQVEHGNTASHFSWRALPEVCRSICLTESYGNHCSTLKANTVLGCV